MVVYECQLARCKSKEGKVYTARVSYEILKVSMLVGYLTAAILAT